MQFDICIVVIYFNYFGQNLTILKIYFGIIVSLLPTPVQPGHCINSKREMAYCFGWLLVE